MQKPNNERAACSTYILSNVSEAAPSARPVLACHDHTLPATSSFACKFFGILRQRETFLQWRKFKFSAFLGFSVFLVIPVVPNSAMAEDVCNRSEQVKVAIVNSLSEVDRCQEVNSELLASIRYLNLSHSSLSNLRENDFIGLSNLIDLDLEDNALSKLAPGQFRELQEIEIIRLTGNDISSLPEGAFANLPSVLIPKFVPL